MVAHVNSRCHGWVVLVVDVVPRACHGVTQDAGLVNPGLQKRTKQNLFQKLTFDAFDYTILTANTRETSLSSGKRQGLTTRAMILGRGFKSHHQIRTKWKPS